MRSAGLKKKFTLFFQDKKAGLASPVLKFEKLEELSRHRETGKLKRFIPIE